MQDELALANKKLIELFAKKQSISIDNVEEFDECIDLIIREIAFNAKFVVTVQYNKDDFIITENGLLQSVKPNAVIKFGSIKPKNNEQYKDKGFLSLYTSYEKLYAENNNEELQTLISTFDDCYNIFQMVNYNFAGLVINPNSDSFVLTKNQIQRIKERKEIELNGMLHKHMPANTTILIGEPPEYPKQAVEKIIEYAKKEKSINAIWVKHMINKNRDNEESILFIVDTTNKEYKEIFSAISEIAEQHIYGFIDFFPYETAHELAIGEPFYKKKKGLFDIFKRDKQKDKLKTYFVKQ